MAPFSIVIIISIIGILFSKRSIYKKYLYLFSISVVVEMNFISGFFIEVNGREFDYSDVTLLVTSVVAVFYLATLNRIKRKQILVSLYLVVAVLIGILHTFISMPITKVIGYDTNWDSYLFGYVSMENVVITSQTILMLIRLFLFLLNSYVVIRFGVDDLRFVSEICKKYTKIHIVYALIEVATKYILKTNIMTEIRNYILGLGRATQSSFQLRGKGVAIYGCTREASHLVEVMFLFWVLCILTKDLKKQKIWLLFVTFIMVISMSFSILMYFVCIGIILIVAYSIRFNKKFIVSIALILVVSGGICYVLLNNKYYMERLNVFFIDVSLIFSGISSFSREMVTSSKVRLLGIRETLRGFYERPLFGLGIGTAYCNSGIVSLLANIGVGGTILWIYYCVHLGINNRKFSQILIVFIATLILPNIFKGGMGMIYSTYNLFFVLLIKIDFDASKRNVSKIFGYNMEKGR